MEIELNHPFWKDYPSVSTLFRGCKKFNTWKSKVGRIGEQIEANIVPINYNCPTEVKEKGPEHISYHFKGAAFEALGECIIKILGSNPAIGIIDYRPTPENDWGVDGIGTGSDGTPAAVQFKFRSEPTTIYGKKDHLNNFVNAALRQYKVERDSDNNMMIFTTAQEVHYRDMVMKWQGKVKYIAPDCSWGCYNGHWKPNEQPSHKVSLIELLDDVRIFWNTICSSIH